MFKEFYYIVIPMGLDVHRKFNPQTSNTTLLGAVLFYQFDFAIKFSIWALFNLSIFYPVVIFYLIKPVYVIHYIFDDIKYPYRNKKEEADQNNWPTSF